MATTKFRTTLAAVLLCGAIGLAGCGSGGAGGAAGSGAGGTTTTTVSGVTTTTVAASPSLSVQLYDATNTVVTTVPPNTSGLTAKATLLDASGVGIPGVVVTFASSSTDLVVSPLTAVTGNNGIASTNVSSTTLTAGGAVGITALASVNGKVVDNTTAPKVVTVVKAVPTISLAVLNSTVGVGSGNCPAGVATSSVDTLTAVGVCATVRDAAGALAPNAVVAFAADSNYLSMTPSTGTRSTAGSGVASISVIGAASTPGGATQITAQATLADGVTKVSSPPVTLAVTGLPANATLTPSLDIKACSAAPCTALNASTSLAVGAPLTVQATLKDGSSNPVPNTMVAFSSADTTLATVSQATALTDAGGVATVRVDAASVAAIGANYINASATTGGKTVTASAPFAVNAATVAIALNISSASISAYGTTSVSATVTVNGQVPSSPMTVQFTSGCASSGKASLQTGVQTVNGVATATYTDKGCAQKDTVVASVNSVQKSGDITVAAPQAANIQFVGTTPASGLLVLRGTGGIGYSETSVVQFTVVDSAGNGMANQSVDFGLTTGLGGITLDSIAYAAGTMTTKQTDANGNVSVTVQSGTAPTAVWVAATLHGSTLSTQSNKLIISTGRPAQDFFSLSATKLNIEGGNYDGAQTTLTVRAADRLGNVVPDGTVINFIAEGAHIISAGAGSTPSSTCSTVNGSCSVILESAEYRPNGDTEPSGLVTQNRVTVLAYALGEETFTDLYGDNIYHGPGGQPTDGRGADPFTDLGNVFIDNNENHAWDAGEQYIAFSAANVSACTNAIATSPYAPSKANSCDGKWGSAHVRRDIVIVLSGNTAKIGNGAPANYAFAMATCTKTFLINLRDQYNNPMAVGTTLTIGDPHVTDTTAPTPYVASITVSSPVGNTNAAGGTFHTITISANNGACALPIAGSFNLNVTTPITNTTTTLPFTVN